MKNNLINPKGLKGNQRVDRIRDLMGIKTITESVVETKALENLKLGPDGKTYGIIRENKKYFIKISDKTQNVGVDDLDYIGGLGNKLEESFSSYRDAIRRLNFKFNELNKVYGNDKNIGVFIMDNELLSENVVDEEKYTLKVPAPPAPVEEPIEEPMGDELGDIGMEDDLEGGEEEIGVEDEFGDEDEEDIIKAVQKLTGKLGQKIREASSEEMDSEMTKYVLNSTLSALDLSLLSEEDIEDAIERLEAGEEQLEDEMGAGEEEGMEEPMGDEFPEEAGGEEEMEIAEDEVAEGPGDPLQGVIISDKAGKKKTKKPFYEGGSIVAESEIEEGGVLGSIVGGIGKILNSKAGKEILAHALEALVSKGKEEIDRVKEMPKEERDDYLKKLGNDIKDKASEYSEDALVAIDKGVKFGTKVGKGMSKDVSDAGEYIGGKASDIAGRLPWRNKEEEIEESTTISKKNILESISEAYGDYYEEDYDHVDAVYEDDSRAWFATENEEPTIEEGPGDPIIDMDIGVRRPKRKVSSDAVKQIIKVDKPKSIKGFYEEDSIEEDCGCGDNVSEEATIEEANPVFDDALSGKFHEGPQTSPKIDPGEKETPTIPRRGPGEKTTPNPNDPGRKWRGKPGPDPRPRGGEFDDINIGDFDDIHLHLDK